MHSKLLYNSRITGVKFSLSGSDIAEKDSYAFITSYDLFRNNVPYPEGVYDAHLGTTDHSYRCQTCYNSKRTCIGHEGSIKLNYPVWNSMAVSEGRKWLKLICFKCGHPCIDITPFRRVHRSIRLDTASKVARTGNKKCVHCKEIHPIIKKDKNEPLALRAEFYEDKRQISAFMVYPHKAAEIFARISNETVIALGKDPSSHPVNFILNVIKVPPVTIRPDVKKIGSGRSTNDDLTTMLQVIIKKSDVMPTVIPADIDLKLEKSIYDLSNSYFDFVRASGEGAPSSLASRLKGKQGRFRKNQMGKRVRNMGRSTIMGDSHMPIDWVGLPLIFARTLQIEEVVQEYNKQKLLGLVQNGRKVYPGATKIIKKATGVEYDVETGRDIELECGDIVCRDLMDGDPVGFNRQPSLMISNISAHRIRVITDNNIRTLPMNVIACSLYNGDFDGDQQNIIAATSTAAINEIAELSSVSNWFVTHATSRPSLGQTNDSVIGMAELTRTNVSFDKYHAMLLFGHSTYLPDFGTEIVSGRDCITKLLRRNPINFTRFAEWYKPNLAPYVNYDPSETKVIIKNGELLQGVLDKKSIGSGAAGGIYHITANEYGASTALDLIYNMQQMSIAYIMMYGFTIGIMDLMVSDEAKKEIDSIAADLVNKSQLIIDELLKGEIIPPIGKTVDEYFEEQQINALSVFDDFTDPIMRSVDSRSNNLLKLIMFGSKGSLSNMFNMMSAVGQKLINGERIRQKFGFKRTLAYFPRFDTSPVSRGYITNSYLAGMSSQEYSFNAMAARFDLISKALSTSVTGEQNRKSIKNLESMIINNFRAAVKNTNIVEIVYGEDYLDPRRVEQVSFPTVMISDKKFAELYSHPDFPEFFVEMKHDRDEYRRIFLNVERMNVKELMTNSRKMPVNIERIIDDVINSGIDTKSAAKSSLREMVDMVTELCNVIPYVLINEIQERKRSPVPDYVRAACWLVCMQIRSYLHPKALVTMNVQILRIIIDRVRLRYSQALVEPGTAVGIIAAQSISEPLTQYVLDAHHRSASGGTSKSGMVKSKEVLGGKSVDKLESASMLIPVLPEYSQKAKVQEIANNIEVMKLNQFVVMWQIFFEKYGEPVHSKYAHESSMHQEFAKLNPLLTPPGDLVKWCLRLVLNKTTLILKNMSLELIVTRLRETFPDIYIVYTPENSPKIVLRIYMRNIMFKGAVSTKDIAAVRDQAFNTIIRGVDGIIGANVVKILRNTIDSEGSIVRDDKWGIVTNGTNMNGIFANEFIDKYTVRSDAIQEVYDMLGIEAARQVLISELRSLADSCNHRHYLVYANEMTYTGRVTPIESSGLKVRESSNILLRVGYSAPLVTLEEAAINSAHDSVTGITGPLLMGSTPRIGTLYNSFYIDRQFVETHVKKPDDLIDELLIP